MHLPEGVLQEMNSTKDKFFIDTNIIIYLFDRSNEKKFAIAKELVKRALESGNGIISFQVIQEFCNVALKKFEKPLSSGHCKTFINRYLFPLCGVFPGMELYNAALDIKDNTGYGFYDSMIIAAAMNSNCNVLYTEDMQDGHTIQGIKIKNPFI